MNEWINSRILNLKMAINQYAQKKPLKFGLVARKH